MTKIDQNEAFSTTTVFLLNKKLEEDFQKEVEKRVGEMQKKLKDVNTVEGLTNCISKYPDGLECIVTLLGVSKEKFKRIVSSIRMSLGHIFESEWDYSAIRNRFTEDLNFRNVLCKLILQGRNDDYFQKIIPAFILNNFVINTDVLARLTDNDSLANLVKDKIAASYNNSACLYYQETVINHLKEIARNNCSVFIANQSISEICTSISKSNKYNVHIIEKNGNKIIVLPHFYMTTGSGQTDFANNVVKPMWEMVRETPKMYLVNMLDGAGWIGRNADYTRIHSACNLFFNLKTIDRLNDFLKEL